MAESSEQDQTFEDFATSDMNLPGAADGEDDFLELDLIEQDSFMAAEELENSHESKKGDSSEQKAESSAHDVEDDLNGSETSIEKKDEKSEDVEIDEVWYFANIQTKEKKMRDQFSNLGEKIIFYMAAYKDWMEKNKARFDNQLCEIDNSILLPFNCPLNTKWIFQFDSIKEKDELIWEYDRSKNQTRNTQEYPANVSETMEVLKSFLNDMTKNGKFPPSPQDVFTVTIRGDRKNKLLVHMGAKGGVSTKWSEPLKLAFHSERGQKCGLKSLLISRINKVNVMCDHIVFGREYIDECIGDIKVHLGAVSNSKVRPVSIEFLSNLVQKYISPVTSKSLIVIGCGNGLLGLTMASKCRKLIGVDSPSNVSLAKEHAKLNNIRNAYFYHGPPDKLINQMQSPLMDEPVLAIIDLNNQSFRGYEVVVKDLRRISKLTKLLVITPGITKTAIKLILSLMHPDNTGKNNRKLGEPFMPTHSCMFDSEPRKNKFEIILLMERTPLKEIIGADRLLKKSATKSLAEIFSADQKKAGSEPPQEDNKNTNGSRGEMSTETEKKLNLEDLPISITEDDKASERFVCNLLDFARTRLEAVPVVTDETVKRIREMLDLATDKAAKLQNQILSSQKKKRATNYQANKQSQQEAAAAYGKSSSHESTLGRRKVAEFDGAENSITCSKPEFRQRDKADGA